MSLIFKLAARNLRRNFRRTVLTMASIAFGLAVVLWLQSVLDGRNRNMIEAVTATYTGHLQIYRKDYFKEKLIQYSFPSLPGNVTSLFPQGTRFARRSHFPALASSGENTLPINLEGIEPEAEASVTQIRSWIKDGEYLSPEPDGACELRQALVGRPLAERLGLKTGNKLVIMGPATDGTLGNELFRVKGIFESGSADFDKGMVYTTLGCVARIGAVQGIHEVVLKLPNYQITLPVQERLTAALPPNLVAVNWMQSVPRLAAVLKYNSATLVLVSGLLFIVISFGIMNTLFLSTFERTREFGTMIALGTSTRQVMEIILAESLLIGMTSSIAGIVLGFAVVEYHHVFGFDIRPFVGDFSAIDNFQLDLVVRPDFHLLPFLKFLFGANLIVVLSALLPAHRASRLNPVETMKSI